jgi:hypothetical protein
MQCITAENYVDMCQRVSRLEKTDTVAGSSNFGRFMECFESNTSEWIEVINGELDLN